MVIKTVLIMAFFLNLFSHAQTKIIIGTIDSEPQEKIYKFQAIASYIQKKLTNKNIKINVEIPKDLNNAISLINNNKLDIFIDSVYPTMLIQKSTGTSIACKRWKNGRQGYTSLIFVRKNSNINSINDLKGKTIAFEDNFSTSSYIIPKKAIEREGLIVSNKDNTNNVKYSYSRSEINTVAWVIFSKVEAGAIDDKSFEVYDEKLFKIIYRSELIPRQLVSFSKNVDLKLKNEILEILYNMDKEEIGKKVLEKFYTNYRC